MFKTAKKDKKSRCQAHGCQNPKVPKRSLCHKHRRRREKELDPVGYAFRVTKQNARRRGKAWSITISEWREFCDRTGYIEKKGRRIDSASIDRINSAKGYSIENIQILSYSENSRKGARPASDCPF